MKLSIVKKLLLIMFAVAIIPFGLKADPAKKVELSYKDGKLKIVAVHPVKDVTEHYIDLIVIKVNDKEVKQIKLTKQSSAAAEELEVALPDLKKGTAIDVKTRCNKYGFKSGSLEL